MVSAALLVISFVSGFDNLFLAHVFPQSALTNPAYFIAAVGSYLALGVVALFTVVPRAERAYIAPIVPLYLFYAIAHIVPMTVGLRQLDRGRSCGPARVSRSLRTLPSASTHAAAGDEDDPAESLMTRVACRRLPTICPALLGGSRAPLCRAKARASRRCARTACRSSTTA